MNRPFRLPTGSAIDRVLACLDSEFLPHVSTAPNVWSDHGNTVHDFARNIGNGDTREVALSRIDPDDPALAACEKLDVTLIPTGGLFEVALAWDHRTGRARVLGADIGRAYEQHGADMSIEFCLTLDFAGVRTGNVGVYVDFKTGWALKRAKDSWQLKLGAVAIADAYGLEEVIVAHQILREGHEPRWDIYEIDAIELATIRKTLRGLAKKLAGEPSGRLVEGDHCTYCPAFKFCDAKTGMIRRLAGAIDAKEPLSGLPTVIDKSSDLVIAQARRAVLMLKEYERAAKIAWKELAAFAEVYPIDLGDGRVYRHAPARAADAVVDPEKAARIIRELYGDEVATRAVSITKGSITKAVGDWARKMGNEIGATQEAAIESLRRAKAIDKKPGKVDARIVDASDSEE